MEVSKVKKTCKKHNGIEIKYFCLQPDCKCQSQLVCAECVMDGPHQEHKTIKIDAFKQKLTKIQLLAKPEFEKSKQKNQGNQQKNLKESQIQHPDLMFQTVNGLTNKIFEDIKKSTVNIIDDCQQDFMQNLEQIVIKQLNEAHPKSEPLHAYSEVQQLLQMLSNGSVQILKITPRQLEIVQELLDKPDDYLLDMIKNNQPVNHNNDQKSDPIDTCQKLIQNKLPILQKMFLDFMNEKCQPFIKSILYDLEIQDQQDDNTAYKITPFQMHSYQNMCKKKIMIHEAGTTEFCKIDDNIIASASHDKTIRIWNVNTGQTVKTIDDNAGGSIISIISILESNIMVSAGYDKNIRIYDTKDFSLKKVIQDTHGDCIIQLCKLNKKYFASASDDFTIKVWQILDFKTYNVLNDGAMQGHSDCVKALARVGDQYLVSGGSDKLVKVWDWRIRTEVHELHGHKDWIRCLCAVSNEMVASGSNDRHVIIWDVVKGIQIRVLNDIQVGSICGLQALSDTYIVTSSFGGQGKLVIYNWKTGEVVKQTVSGNGGFHSLLVQNDKTIVQGMGDGEIRIWR